MPLGVHDGLQRTEHIEHSRGNNGWRGVGLGKDKLEHCVVGSVQFPIQVNSRVQKASQETLNLQMEFEGGESCGVPCLFEEMVPGIGGSQ